MTARTYGEAMADPTSSVAKFHAKARESMRANNVEIARLMALGKTHEEAWAALIARMS